MPQSHHHRRPRVVFVDQVGETPGGAQRTLATFLRAAVTDVEAIAILFEDGAFADELRAIGIIVDIVAASRAVMSLTREESGFASASTVPSLLWRVVQRLRTYRPVAVYTNSMKAHVIGSVAARLTNIPCIIHFHDLLEGRALRTLQTACRIASKYNVACSNLVASKMGVANTRVIYSPVCLSDYSTLVSRADARAALGLDGDYPTIALVGRINRWKGHDLFIKIAALVNKMADARFLIVGSPVFRDEDFLPELEDLVRTAGLESKVSFIPWVSDVRVVYAAIDINVNCSHHEPFGRTIAEAAAAGIPSICFNDSGACETIQDGENGRVIPYGDTSAFAESIIKLVNNPAVRSRMALTARERAARFDAPKIARETVDVITQVIKEP